jgi:hypothetical protein
MNAVLAIETNPSYAKPGVGFVLLAVAATALYWLYLRWRIGQRRKREADRRPDPP